MPHETLIVERDGPVLEVTMNRPEARNALSPTMVRELTEVFQQARDDAFLVIHLALQAPLRATSREQQGAREQAVEHARNEHAAVINSEQNAHADQA